MLAHDFKILGSKDQEDMGCRSTKVRSKLEKLINNTHPLHTYIRECHVHTVYNLGLAIATGLGNEPGYQRRAAGLGTVPLIPSVITVVSSQGPSSLAHAVSTAHCCVRPVPGLWPLTGSSAACHTGLWWPGWTSRRLLMSLF